MNVWKPTYLYVKTHKITGLKYFGKTIQSDPSKYKGSGKHWRRHLTKHGNLVETQILGLFLSEYECVEFATRFSLENNIVESNIWANLKSENGLDGSPPGLEFTEEHKENIRLSRLGKCYNKFTEETRAKMSAASKIKIIQQQENDKSAWYGEKGSKFAKSRNEKLLNEGKHNWQGEAGSKYSTDLNNKRVSEGTHNFLKNRNTVSVVDSDGKSSRIDKEIYWNQAGPKELWEYAANTSKIAKQRLNKEITL